MDTNFFGISSLSFQFYFVFVLCIASELTSRPYCAMIANGFTYSTMLYYVLSVVLGLIAVVSYIGRHTWSLLFAHSKYSIYI